MGIQENISLKELTTLKIGGKARFFCSVSNVEELARAIVFAADQAVPVTILGGGSNVLITEGTINRLFIKIEIYGIEWTDESESVLAIAGGGESWDKLVSEAVQRNLWGIENLSGIPGTVGAAPVQNIGAYGTEIQSAVEWVEVFDTQTGATDRLSNAKCKFSYRNSVFKELVGKKLIITRVALRLQKSGTANLEYKDLKEIFNSQFSIFNEEEKKEKIRNLPVRDIRKAVLEIRGRKFPDLKTTGTAGSFFKNPIISAGKFSELKKKYPNLPGFPLSDVTGHRSPVSVKVSLAWILDALCGMKGFQKGDVALFERQPIVLVNTGRASAEEVGAFAQEVSACVKEKTGIDIEWEVQRIS